MAEFKYSYNNFESHVKSSMRYIWDSETEDFLATVLATSQKRLELYKSGTTLWRAQLGNDYAHDGTMPIPIPYAKSRMKPLAEKAKEGRLNPKGIPVLYLSMEPNTAMSEVRPWVGSLISLAKLTSSRDLNIVDCSKPNPINSPDNLFNPNPEPEIKENRVWNDINMAFSKPVTNSDDTADYAPTQILAELFKREGYHGVGYKSGLGKGLNLALFDVDAAIIDKVKLCKVNNISFGFIDEPTEDQRLAISNYLLKGQSKNEKKP